MRKKNTKGQNKLARQRLEREIDILDTKRREMEVVYRLSPISIRVKPKSTSKHYRKKYNRLGRRITAMDKIATELFIHDDDRDLSAGARWYVENSSN